MKISRIFYAACASLSLAGLAQADTVHVTGSTAFRANLNKAITNLAWDGNTFTQAYVGTAADVTGANIAIFKGTIGGTAVIIKTSLNGSEAGVESVSGSIALPAAQNFLADGTTTVTVTKGAQTNSGSGTASSNQTDTTVPEVAMSDTYQSSSQFYNNTLTLTTGSAVTFAALSNAANGADNTGIVGVVPFKFCASRGAALTGITSQQARAIFSSTRTSLALISGLATDVGTQANGKFIYGTGRNPDSGTRLSALAEIGLGALGTVKQYQPSDASGNQITTAGGSVTQNKPFPSGTVNFIAVNTGNNGYDSGGNLAKALNNTTSTMTTGAGASAYTGGSYVSYLGTNDADPQITGSAATGIVELSYNGVTLGKLSDYNTSTDLTYGRYTFWAYEHMYYRAATAGTAIGNLADSIAVRLYNNDAAVLVTNMHATRTNDGAVVVPQ